MTDHIKNPMRDIVSDVIAGSMITQRASKLGIDSDQLLNSSSPDTTEISAALTEFGLNPDIIAIHALLSISVFLKNPEIVDTHIKSIAQLLWNSLGDPEHNGASPPIHYKEAADCVYTWLVLSLMPYRFAPPQ